MKIVARCLFILLFLWSFPGITEAQFSFGIKAGYNAATLSANIDSVKSGTRSGFQVGAYTRIGKSLYLQPELYYSLQGGVFTSNTQGWKETLRVGSLDIPVLLGLTLLRTDLIRLRVMAGPALSVVVNKQVEEAYSDASKQGPLTRDDLRSAAWSLHAGAGVDAWRLTFDVRYQAGLSKLIGDVEGWTFDSRQNTWIISLGFKLL